MSDTKNKKMRDPLKITVLASGDGSNLQVLLDKAAQGLLGNCMIHHVLSNRPESHALERAQKAGVASLCIDHTKFARREDFDRELYAAVSAENPQLVVLAGFMRILGESFVLPLHNHLINLHPSLLPRHPGRHTHRQALAHGDSEHGATVHYVIPELDAGPRIIQGSIPVYLGEEEDHLKSRVGAVEHQILPLAVEWFVSGQLQLNGSSVLLDGVELPSSGKIIYPEIYADLPHQNAETLESLE